MLPIAATVCQASLCERALQLHGHGKVLKLAVMSKRQTASHVTACLLPRSRNALLSEADRAKALSISQALRVRVVQKPASLAHATQDECAIELGSLSV